MKKETIKTIINTICTILSAIAAAITTSSCCTHMSADSKEDYTKHTNITHQVVQYSKELVTNFRN